jgi:Class III cytochrome C family
VSPAGRLYRRLAIACGLAGLLLWAPPAVFGGLLWDLGVACGYVAIVLMVLLYLYPLRGDGLPHERLLRLSQHRVMGWATLGAVLTHVAVQLGSQPRVGRYLLPSAPLFMWCGAAALVIVAVLVYTGLAARSAARRPRMGGAHGRATLHLVLAAAVLLTTAAHVIGSGQATVVRVRSAVLLLLLAIPLAWYAVRPRLRPLSSRALKIASAACACGLVLALSVSYARLGLLRTPVSPARIPVVFPHEKHFAINCTTCHHNFLDHTGSASCIDCHRSARLDLPQASEATFHTFCRDCHATLALEGAKHGPTRSCSACHGD